MDIDRLARELPASTFRGWQAFAAREPFGPAAWDARIGHVLAVLVNALTGQPCRAADFVPKWESEPPQSFEVMYQTFQDWKHAHHRKN